MHCTRSIIYVAVAALAIAGCAKKKEAGTGSGSGTGMGTGTGTGTGTGSAEEALPAAVPVDTAAVQALVDAWLAAQNGGDFAAYQALYADKMEGVKRVGPRTTRFDRAGWLADRERMFKHPMTVAAKDVAIDGSATAPTVEFVQSFAQGRFSDEGPKRIVLTKTAAGLRITREEMLQSTVGAPAATGADPVALVVEVDQRYQVVIDASGDDAWASGRITGPYRGIHTYAMRDAAKAPAAAAWTGKALTVYGADGDACPATVGAVRLLGGGTPHFGEVQLWDGDPAMSADGRKWTKGERARAVYEMGGLYLVGELQITGACKPLFAMDVAAKPVVFTAADADADADADARDAAALAAFRKLPAYKTLQQSFTGDYQGQGDWAPSPTVTAYGAGANRYVVVSANEGSGCGDFLGQLAAVFAWDGRQARLVSNPDAGFLSIDALIDSDGDGALELIGAEADFSTVIGHLTPSAGGFATRSSVSFPFNDCGC